MYFLPDLCFLLSCTLLFLSLPLVIPFLSDHPHCLYLMTFHHILIYQVCMCMLSHISHVQLFVTLWTVAYQAPLSMGFSRKEYWSGLPCPPPGDLSNPGIEPASPTSNLHWQAGALPLALPGKSLLGLRGINLKQQVLDKARDTRQRSLEGYSPEGHKESDMTEVT